MMSRGCCGSSSLNFALRPVRSKFRVRVGVYCVSNWAEIPEGVRVVRPNPLSEIRLMFKGGAAVKSSGK